MSPKITLLSVFVILLGCRAPSDSSELRRKVADQQVEIKQLEERVRRLEGAGEAARQPTSGTRLAPTDPNQVSPQGSPETTEPRHPAEDPKVAIREFCGKKWGSNWTMVEFCQKGELAAMEKVHEGNTFGVPSSVYGEIRWRCEQKWWPQFSMQLYCQQQEADAYKRIH